MNAGGREIPECERAWWIERRRRAYAASGMNIEGQMWRIRCSAKAYGYNVREHGIHADGTRACRRRDLMWALWGVHE